MKKILIVDDNDDIRFTLIDGLKSINSKYDFVDVGSGKEALHVLGLQRIDLILLDIMMPGMDGWDVSTRIKSNAEWKSIPIIFLTAVTDNVSKRMGKLVAEDYIEKPFEITDLKKRMVKIIGE